MKETGTRFIISVPNSMSFAKEQIDEHRSEIANRSEFRLGKDLLYAKAVIREGLGVRIKAYIYYNLAKAADEEDMGQGLSDMQIGKFRI